MNNSKQGHMKEFKKRVERTGTSASMILEDCSLEISLNKNKKTWNKLSKSLIIVLQCRK
jgi:hypothetical protein